MTAATRTGEATITALKLRNLDPSARIAGHEPGWIAPVGVFNAANGFADEVWTDSIPETVVAISLSGAPVVCCWGRRKDVSSLGQSSVALQPKGTPNHYLATGANRFAQIYLPDRLINRVAEGLGSSTPYHDRLREDFAFQAEPQFEDLVRTYVERVCSESEPGSAIEIEARATLLVEYMLRRLHGLAPTPRTSERGGLAPWQIRRTTEFLQDNIARDVALSELAGVAKLSPFHFARAFKASLGRPPHAYLRDLRIARAKAMLVETDLAVTEIAALVGYEAPQTLGKAFRRETGVTPSDYRRERRA